MYREARRIEQQKKQKKTRVNLVDTVSRSSHMILNDNNDGNNLRWYFQTRLKEISCKGYEMVKICQDSWADPNLTKVPDDKGIVFIYIPRVNGSGAIDLATMLTCNGYDLFTRTDTIFEKKLGERRAIIDKRKRVAILTSNTRNQNLAIFDTLNSKENMYGHYIQVIIVSEIGEEGINIYNAVKYINFSPNWNYAKKIQSEDRVFRAVSHEDRLDVIRKRYIDEGKDPRNAYIDVKIYYMCSIHIEEDEPVDITGKGVFVDYDIKQVNIDVDGISTVDIRKHGIIDSKAKNTAIIRRFVKIIDYVCQLNYERNVRPTDVNDSTACDFQECNYECSGINDDIMKDVDWTTKLMHFSTKDAENAAKEIKKLFVLKSSYKINELIDILNHIKPLFIYMGIEKLLHDNETVTNNFGFFSYIRMSENILYLDNDEFSFTSNPENTTYTSELIGTQNQNSNIFLEYLYNLDLYDGLVEKLLIPNISDEQFMRDYNDLSLINKALLLESTILLIFKNNTYNEFYKKILDLLDYVLYSMKEPISLLERSLYELRTRGQSKGRKPKPGIKTKVKKITQEEMNEISKQLNDNNETIYIHSLLGQIGGNVQYGVVSKFSKAEGRLRILKLSEGIGWRDLTEYEHSVYNNLIQKAIYDSMKEYDKFGIYGIYINGQFRIKETKTKLDEDPKYKFGRLCGTLLTHELIELYYKLGYKPKETNIGNVSRADMIDLLSGKFKDAEKFSDEKLREYYLWSIDSSLQASKMCERIIDNFTKEGRIFTGKVKVQSKTIDEIDKDIEEDINAELGTQGFESEEEQDLDNVQKVDVKGKGKAIEEEIDDSDIIDRDDEYDYDTSYY